MDNNQQLFSVSELAEQIGVPRTTITDWLSKYERFIDARMQGKRRFYTTRSLEVLKSVAEMRNAGRSLYEIDSELEHMFAIHATVEPIVEEPSEQESPAQASSEEQPVHDIPADPETTEQGDNPDPGLNADQAADTGAKASDDQPAEADTPSPDESYAMVKQDADVAELVNAKFADLCNSMEEMNKKSAKSAVRLKMIFALTMLAVVFVLGVFVLIILNLLATRDGQRDMAESMSGQTLALDTGVSHITGRVDEVNSGLEGMRTEVGGFSKELSDLKAQLKDQQDKFDAELEKQLQRYEQGLASDKELYETKLAVQKELFAAERLAFLQDTERLQQENKLLEGNDADRTRKLKEVNDELARKDERIAELQKKQEELDRKLQEFTTQKTQLEAQLENQRVRLEAQMKETGTARSQAEEATRRAESLERQNHELQQALQQHNNTMEVQQ